MKTEEKWLIFSERWPNEVFSWLLSHYSEKEVKSLVSFFAKNKDSIRVLSRLVSYGNYGRHTREYRDEYINALHEPKIPRSVLESLKPTPQERKAQHTLKPQKQTYIYLMRCNRNQLVKIGKSRKPSARESTLQSEDPSIEMIGFWKGTAQTELELHREFSELRVRGEWFKLTDQQVQDIVSRFGGAQ